MFYLPSVIGSTVLWVFYMFHIFYEFCATLHRFFQISYKSIKIRIKKLVAQRAEKDNGTIRRMPQTIRERGCAISRPCE